MDEWTKSERAWISRARRLFRDKPNTVLLYSTDGEISACKLGVMSYDLSTQIANGAAINSGCVLTDMHDDSGRGA